MKSNKVIALLREGFRFETLSKLNESQINTLYGRLIHEQSISAATQKAKEELVGLNKTVDDIAKKIASEEDNVEADDALGDLAMQTDTGQETPHDEKDMAPDGMDDDSDNNRTTMGEEVEKDNAWAICTSQLGKEFKTTKRSEWSAKQMNKYERCVKDVKKQNETVRQIEESLVSLIQKYVMTEKMTKKDILEADTKEAPVKTPVKTPTKPDRKSPYQPKHQPAPKAGDTKEAPVKTPVKTPTKPDRKSPYQPKHQPAPKAELPDFLKFKNLNIQFRDENQD